MNLSRLISFTILALNLTIASYSQTSIKLKKENGLYLVPCSINGIPFRFYFDTGASLVSLSLKEANILYAAGKLSKADIIGKRQMEIANGQVVDGTIVLLREIKIGSLTLKDIEAVITSGQNAPLLLGQSAIRRFGSFTFNYATETLTITKIPNKITDQITPRIFPELKKGLSAEQIASYEEFYDHKSDIIKNLSVQVAKYKSYMSTGDRHVSFSLDITNNSDYDFVHSKQLRGNPVKIVNIVVTVETEEGSTYTEKQTLTDLLAHNTISTHDSFIDVNIRNNTLKGVKIRVIDLDF